MAADPGQGATAQIIPQPIFLRRVQVQTMIPSLSFRRVAFLAAGLAALFSCGPTQEVTGAEDGDEAASVTSNESALTSELSDEATQPMSASAADLAASAGTRVGSHLQPASCFTRTVTGSTVVFVLTDCTGPYGLVHLTGTLTAVYSRDANGGVDVTITGSGVKANGAVIDLDATVVATQTNGARGCALSCEGTYELSYDPGSECLTLNGTWTTTVGLKTASTTIANYTRCKGTCPAAGGSLVHVARTGAAVTVTYDGSANASWASTNGKSGTIALICSK
jgi:hypothetical protein